MRIKSIDLVEIPFWIIAISCYFSGQINGWIVLLFFLSKMKIEYKPARR